MAKFFDCPACGERKPEVMATSRYLDVAICADCATREAFEGAFWPRASEAWAQTQAKILLLKAQRKA